MPTVKTAISLEQDLFSRAEEFASSQKLSRSRVVSLALEEYLRRQENLALLEKINASYDDTPDPEEEKHLRAAQRSFLKVADKW
jgi:metal-responsive CopG/Arc/MetJ family transcriptional regulator